MLIFSDPFDSVHSIDHVPQNVAPPSNRSHLSLKIMKEVFRRALKAEAHNMQQAVYPKRAHFSLCVTCGCETDPSGQPTCAAQRRRGRRLRAALRHERSSGARGLTVLLRSGRRSECSLTSSRSSKCPRLFCTRPHSALLSRSRRWPNSWNECLCSSSLTSDVLKVRSGIAI